MKKSKIIGDLFQPMCKFRGKFLFKFTVHFLLFALLFVSCTTDPIVNTNIKTKDNITDYRSDNTSESIGLYNALEIVRTVGYQNAFTTPDEYINYFFEDRESFNEYSSELNSYHEMGFDSSLNQLEDNGQISTNMKNWSIEFENDLNDFLINQKPTQEEFFNYLSDINRFLYVDNYSEGDMILISDIINKTKDSGKYFYIHYYSNNLELREADCNFFESISCFLLSIPYYAFINTFVLPATTSLIYGTQEDDDINRKSWGEIYIGLHKVFSNQFWEWCCGVKEKEACGEPEGSFYKVKGCNSYEYVVYGPGTYSTTIWGPNTNTNPLDAVTPTSKILISTPNPGGPSILKANILCLGDPSESFSWLESLTFEGEDPIISLSWGQYVPPYNVDIMTEYELEVTCNVFGNSHYTFTWSQSDVYEIHGSNGDYIIEFEEEASGSVTVVFTVENVCTGAIETISKTFNVNN